MVIVLGMHDSGTSCLAGAVIASGVDFGVVRATNEHDPILRLHVQMVRWDDPVDAAPTGANRAERDRIIGTFSPPWGFKDPMALFTIDFWREALDAQLVGTFRDPRKVMAWLAVRHPRHAAPERLWIRYNARLLALHDEAPFPLVSFDPESYVEDVRVALGALGLSGESPFDPLRRRTARHEGALSSEANDLHQELLRRSRDRGTSSASA